MLGDPDDLPNAGPHQNRPIANAIATAFGGLLVLLGLVACVWLFIGLVAIIGGERPPRLVDALVEAAADTPVDVEVENQVVRFSPGTVRLIAWPTVALFYAVAGTLAIGVTRAGVALLQPDLGAAMRDLAARLDAARQSRKS